MNSDPHTRAFSRFDAAMGKLLALPREEYQQRLAAFKDRPKTRGPKAKIRPVSSPGPAEKPQV